MGKKSVRKSKVERPYNCGTLTNAGFWGMIRSALRQKSRYWKPVAECKKLARRKYNGPNNRQKFEYQCNICKNYFAEKEISVDHIIPAGRLTRAEDLPGFVTRLFCTTDQMQCLCHGCHNVKTLEDRIKLKEETNV